MFSYFLLLVSIFITAVLSDVPQAFSETFIPDLTLIPIFSSSSSIQDGQTISSSLLTSAPKLTLTGNSDKSSKFTIILIDITDSNDPQLEAQLLFLQSGLQNSNGGNDLVSSIAPAVAYTPAATGQGSRKLVYLVMTEPDSLQSSDVKGFTNVKSFDFNRFRQANQFDLPDAGLGFTADGVLKATVNTNDDTGNTGNNAGAGHASGNIGNNDANAESTTEAQQSTTAVILPVPQSTKDVMTTPLPAQTTMMSHVRTIMVEGMTRSSPVQQSSMMHTMVSVVPQPTHSMTYSPVNSGMISSIPSMLSSTYTPTPTIQDTIIVPTYSSTMAATKTLQLSTISFTGMMTMTSSTSQVTTVLSSTQSGASASVLPTTPAPATNYAQRKVVYRSSVVMAYIGGLFVGFLVL